MAIDTIPMVINRVRWTEEIAHHHARRTSWLVAHLKHINSANMCVRSSILPSLVAHIFRFSISFTPHFVTAFLLNCIDHNFWIGYCDTLLYNDNIGRWRLTLHTTLKNREKKTAKPSFLILCFVTLTVLIKCYCCVVCWFYNVRASKDRQLPNCLQWIGNRRKKFIK